MNYIITARDNENKIRATGNMKLFDSLHLATATVHHIDYFITTDDKFLKQAVRQNLNIRILSPGEWYDKEGKYYD